MSILNSLMVKVGIDTSELDRGLKETQDKVKGFGDTAKGVFAGNLIYDGVKRLSSALFGLASDSVKAGMNFDKAMSQVQATMLKTDDEMEASVGSVDTAFGHFEGNLREFSQFLGENTAFSATQAAEALNYMALAGYNTQESMDMLPNVLNLAAAGNFDLARASDMVTDTQTAFGISAERTTQLVDEMAKAASTGNTSVEQLGDAFLVVGGLAKELNGGFVTLGDGTQVAVDGFTEMEIAFTAMANSGIKGSSAGTHMRNMLMKLSSPTKEGTEQLEKLGVAIFDDEGRMRSLKDIMGDLNGALGDLTQEEKIQAISDLFNARDLSSANALLAAIGQDWDEIGASIVDSKDAASKMAEIQLDNLAGDVTLFKSALEGAQIAISDKLSPALRQFVGGGTKLLQGFTTAFKTRGLQGVMDMGANLVKRLTYGISKSLPKMIPVAMQTIMEFSGNLRENAGKLVDAGIALITVIARSLVDNIPVFIQTIPTIISNIAGIINDNAPKLLVAGFNIIKMIAQGIIDSWPVIVEEFPKIIAMIVDIWQAVNWMSLGTKLIATIGVGIKALASHIPNLLSNIGKMALNLFKGIDWAGLGMAVIRLVVAGIYVLFQNIPTVLRAIGLAGLNIVKNIDWAGLGNKVINFIVSGLQALFVDIPNKLKSIGKDAWEKFKSIDWKGVGSKVINFIVSGLAEIGSKIKNKLKSIGDDAWEAFKGISWSGLGSAIIDGIISGIGDGWSLIQKLKDLAADALQAAKDRLTIKSPSKAFRDEVGKMIPAGIAVGIDDNTKDVTNAIQSMSDAAVKSWDAELAEMSLSVNKNDNEMQYDFAEANNALIYRMDRILGVLEYYLPKRTLNGEMITNVVSNGINKQVKELSAVW